MTVTELKRALSRSGFEIYRTLSNGVALVERVRENLILDSGVRVEPRADGFVVRVVFRAEGRGFPGESEEQMRARVHALSSQATAADFVVIGAEVVPQMDPARPGIELDRFYEESCERALSSFDEAIDVVRAAFGWTRSIPAQ